MVRPDFMVEFYCLSFRGDPMETIYEMPLYYTGLQIEGVKYAGFDSLHTKDVHYLSDVLQHYMREEGIDYFDSCTLSFKTYTIAIFNYNSNTKKWELG